MGGHYDRALVLLDHRRPDLAEREIRQELAAEPDCAWSHAVLGRSLGHQGRLEDAAAALAEATRLAPDLGYAHRLLGWVRRQEGRWTQAEESLLEAIRLDPQDIDAIDDLAFVQHQQGRNEQALRTAEQGLQLDPEHVGCINNRAVALSDLGQHQEAEAALQAALTKDPEDDRTWHNRAWIFLRQEKHAQALANYREALRLDPDDRGAAEGLRCALSAMRQGPVAIVLLLLFGAVGMGLQVDRFIPFATWNPHIARGLLAIVAVAVVFFLSDLFGPYVGDLAVCCRRVGRTLLTPAQVTTAMRVGVGCLVLAGLTVAAVAAANDTANALLCALAIAPLAASWTAIFRCQAGRKRFMVSVTAALIAAVSVAGVAAVLTGVNLTCVPKEQLVGLGATFSFLLALATSCIMVTRTESD